MLNISDEYIPSDFNIYIVRHGQGNHNAKKTKLGKMMSQTKIKDASLTDAGIEQAEDAGKEIKNIMFSYFFVSDLKRTRQTMAKLLLKNDHNINKTNQTVYVLPCAHELKYNSEGCDKSNSLVKNITDRLSVENLSSCTNEMATRRSNNECNTGGPSNNIYVNWMYYFNFYGDEMRKLGKDNKCGDEKECIRQCYNTNMISMCLFIINRLEGKYVADMNKWISDNMSKPTQ